MNRREFLRYSGIALAGAALPAARAAAEPWGQTLGYSLYGMKSLDLAYALETCAAIGYRNVELTVFPGYAAEPSRLDSRARQALREKLATLGLTVSSLMLNLSLVDEAPPEAAQLETIRAAARLARDLAPH